MPGAPKLSSNEKKLIRRYLIWCYKTTKESLDRVDRKYTQLTVDDHVLGQLEKKRWLDKSKLNEFKQYIASKKADALKEKFSDDKFQVLTSSYEYLQNRFSAIEKTIIHFFSKSELKQIDKLYEQEMTQRILQTREHT